MSNALSQSIEQLSREKGVESKVIYEALEDAMAAAARKHFRTEEDLQARYDPVTGTIEVFAVKRIVEEVEEEETEMALSEALQYDESFEVGDYLEIPKPPLELGRIAAQTAKQVIFQKVREAERENVFEEYSARSDRWSTGSCGASRGATSCWTSAGPRPCCPTTSRPAPKNIGWGIACERSSSRCTVSPRGPRSWFPEGTPAS